MTDKTGLSDTKTNIVQLKEQLLSDYRIACLSREASLLGRKEVLTGKAKFGIFGDGKELPQIAFSKVFRKGDFRSGYYRDQTFMFAKDLLTVQEYYAALYGHANLSLEPTSGGRQMGGHFATRSLNEDGSWKNLMEQYNSSADISPTAGQMPRLLGLAYASKMYRENENLHFKTDFSDKGNEIAFGTIGDASTSEGLFWETMNAAAVLKVPMILSVWDDGYGISVPKKYQTVKESISKALSGFSLDENGNGIKIFKANAWNYPELLATYEEADHFCRKNHIPVLVHIEECTQPQGHSTSGSHERYKSKERLEWAEEFDCIKKFSEFIIMEGAATQEELDAIRKETKKKVRAEQKEAWKNYSEEIEKERQKVLSVLNDVANESDNRVFIEKIKDDLAAVFEPIRKDLHNAVRSVQRMIVKEDISSKQNLLSWLKNNQSLNYDRYSSHLYSESADRIGNVDEVNPVYSDESEMVDGRLILRENFDVLFDKHPEILTFGEDTGKIGGVNQSMEGMQEKYSDLRVTDTGIREATIIGQGIGLSLRGLRPIAEIQYLDYLYYALQILRDDLATVQYRTKGGQKAPLIIRTRGHRLEGIWHSGSPMSSIISSVRGMHVCVPRNMTQAAGMYNTLIDCDEPALVVERLNAYRSKELMPANLGEFKVPLGKAEVIREGQDITVVSYGSTLDLCEKAALELEKLNISIELVDVQTLLPFDVNHVCLESIKKTNRVVFIDEDVPGGATSFMMDKVLNEQKAFFHLDAEPKTVAAKPHLPAYGTDGDYFSKPSIDDIVEEIYDIFNEVDPANFPSLY